MYLNGDFIEAKFKDDETLVEFGKFIQSEFDYSKVSKPGTMMFSFTINKNGEVKNIKVVQILDIESATEIIRVVKKCHKWEPVKRKVKAISIEIKFPMTFKKKIIILKKTLFLYNKYKNNI